MQLKKLIATTLRGYLNEEQETLNEGASDILYHFTYTGSLLNILKTNEFSLTSAIGSSPDFKINKKKYFYLSTTRSRSTGFKKGDVKLVLDGRKLKNNNKITPVDYWQRSKDKKNYNDDNSYMNALQSTEQEDRIVSDKATIPNAINYINEIHIFIDTKYVNPGKSKLIKEIFDICNNNRIKLYMYDNKTNWLNQIKPISNDIEFNIEDDSDDERGYVKNYFEYGIASLLAYNDLGNYNIIKNHLNDDLKIKKLDDTLKEKTNSCFKINAYNFDEGIASINREINSIRRSSDKNDRLLLLLLANELKKYKVFNIKDYIIKKQFKNKKTLDDYKKDLKSFFVSKMLDEYVEGLNYYFDHYIEIDGKYYNHAYESDEILKVIYDYINKIREYLDSVIFSEKDDIFRYVYFLSTDYIKKYINFDDIKLSNEIKITDSYDDIEDIDTNFKYLIHYYLIQPINSNYFDKINSLKDEYAKNIED